MNKILKVWFLLIKSCCLAISITWLMSSLSATIYSEILSEFYMKVIIVPSLCKLVFGQLTVHRDFCVFTQGNFFEGIFAILWYQYRGRIQGKRKGHAMQETMLRLCGMLLLPSGYQDASLFISTKITPHENKWSSLETCMCFWLTNCFSELISCPRAHSRL